MARLLIGTLREPGYDLTMTKNGGKFVQHYFMEFRFKIL